MRLLRIRHNLFIISVRNRAVSAESLSHDDLGEKPWRDRQTVERLYHDEDMTQEEIADFLGCGDGTVNRWVHNFDLDVRSVGSTNEKIRDVDLGALYWEEGLSQSEIAERCDCSVGLVSKQMDEQGVPVRGGYEGEPCVYTGTQQGYQRCYVRDVDETKKFLIHRLTAVAKFGYDAVVEKVVHHKNEVKWDNRPSSLELMENDEHASHHHPANQ